MNDIVEHKAEENLPAAISTEKAMIQRIAEMAADPNCDPDKMEKLLNVQIKMMDRQAKIDFDQALADLQMEMPRITPRGEIKNANGEVTSKYMKYEDIDRVIRPMLQKHGFSLVHDAKEEQEKMVVTTWLKHRGGHQESVSSPLPFDQPNKLKSPLQAAASTEAFGKRRNVCKILNIVSESEENDAFVGYIKIDESQKTGIINALKETDADVAKFLQFMGVDCVDNIFMKDYPKAYLALRRKVLQK